MKIENRQQLLVMAAAAIIGLFLLDRLIVGPLTDGWKDRSRRIAELQKSIASGQATLKRDPVVRQRWAEMKSNTLAPETAEQNLLEAFQRWSRASNVPISAIHPQWRRSEDYSTLECQANVVGSISAIAQFLYNLESDPMALRIESLEITSRDEAGQNLALALQVSGLVLGTPAQ